jgi:hypothetical protein
MNMVDKVNDMNKTLNPQLAASDRLHRHRCQGPLPGHVLDEQGNNDHYRNNKNGFIMQAKLNSVPMVELQEPYQP